MATIVLDPGHGGRDPGAVNGTRLEKDDNLRLGLALRTLLQNQGHYVIMTRSTDEYVSLADRSDISNRSNADIFVSLHRNAFTNPQTNGIETIISTSPTQEERHNAQLVQDAMVAVAAQSDRGVRQMNFAVLRNTLAPAMMTELGFISNAHDNELFDLYFDDYACAIANAITAIIAPAPYPPIPPTPPMPPAPTVFDRIIANIQNTLNSLFNKNLRVDGVYGPQTQQALLDSLQTELHKPPCSQNNLAYLQWALGYVNNHCTNPQTPCPTPPCSAIPSPLAPQPRPAPATQPPFDMGVPDYGRRYPTPRIEPNHPGRMNIQVDVTVNGRRYNPPVPITPTIDVC